jgi:hypothetical protein
MLISAPILVPTDSQGEAIMQAQDLEVLKSLPPPTMCRLIDFKKAHVFPGFLPKTWFLVVTGEKPWASMTVQLVPLIYIQQPDYWGIEVVGCQHGFGIPIAVPYSITLDITHFIGKVGIEVIGAINKEKIKVP